MGLLPLHWVRSVGVGGNTGSRMGFSHFSFGDFKTALPSPPAPPAAGSPMAKAERRSPFDPAPLQGLRLRTVVLGRRSVTHDPEPRHHVGEFRSANPGSCKRSRN